MSRHDFPSPWPCAFRGLGGLPAPALVLALAAVTLGTIVSSWASGGDAPAAPTGSAAPKEDTAVGAKPGKGQGSAKGEGSGSAPAGVTGTGTGTGEGGPGHELVDGEIDTLARGKDLAIGETLREVVRDAEAWKALWARLHASVEPVPPLPTVDFGRDMVLAASSGKQPTAGFAVVIRGSDHRGDDLVVYVEVRKPRPDAIVAQQVTHAYHVVRHLKFDGKVVFEDRDPPKAKPR